MQHTTRTTTDAARTSALLLFATLLALLVILLGAYTRLTNAGLSCPDWPHCYGYLTAPHTDSQIAAASQLYPQTPVNVKAAWTEMTHRYFAGLEGLLLLVLAYRIRKSSPLTAILFLALLGVQVTLGMLTVTEKLKPVIVLSHLITGLSILSALWWTYLSTTKKVMVPPHTRPWLWLGLLIVIGQITLGGWVSTHYAGLACIDFPYCNGKLLPDMQWQSLNTDLITIHMLHRIGALITAGYLLLMSSVLWSRRVLCKTILFVLCLVGLQITLGILNLYWLRPVWLALTHHAVGILILLTFIAIINKTKTQDK